MSHPWKKTSAQQQQQAFKRDKTQNIDVSISERKAYEFLCRQQEARDWMEEVSNQKMTGSTANFCDNLRDGVMLCLLAQAFMPGSVGKIQRPSLGSVLAFMATDNINQFFRACEKANFPKTYMFSVPDLWERKNVYNVVHCLHTLARFLVDNEYIKIRIKNYSKANLKFSEEEIKITKETLEKIEASALPDFPDLPADEPEEVPAHVSDDEDPISDDPVESEADLADPDKCIISGDGAKKGVAGVQSVFTIQARDPNGNDIKEGGEQFNVILINKQDSSVRITAKVKDCNNGKYEVTYTPEKSGAYTMEAQLVDVVEDDEEDEPQLLMVQGCPMTVNIDASPQVDASKSEIQGLGTESAVAGVATTFTVQTKDKFGNANVGSEAPKATLTHSAKGTTVDAEVKDEGNGLYTFTYTCPLSGSYKLDIKVGDEPLASKDVVVKDAGISDPSNTSITDLPTAGSKKLRAGELVEFTIEAKDKHGNIRSSGGEKFEVQLLDTAGNSATEVNIVDTNDGKYKVSFTPTKSGEFDVSVQLSGAHVSGAPFKVHIEDAGKTETSNCSVAWNRDFTLEPAKAGEQITISVTPKDLFGNARPQLDEGEKFAVVVFNKNKREEAVHTFAETIVDGAYPLSFTLQEADEYSVEVLLQKADQTAETLAGFPTEIKVVDSGVTHAPNTAFEGDGLVRATSNQAAKFTIVAHDQFNNTRSAGGDDVKVVLINPKRNLTFTAEVTDMDDGTYEVNYLPTTFGAYKVQVTINGELVNNASLNPENLSLFIEAPDAKAISRNELDTIHDHDLLSSLMNTMVVEQDNEGLTEAILKLREQLIKQIRLNTEVEKDVRELERKIELLINNRLKVEQVLEGKGGLFGLFGGKKKTVAKAAGESQDSTAVATDKLSLYGKLFYLLQTDPKYLSSTLYLVPPEKVDSFLEVVILTLYGYAFSPREEYLILSLFRMTLQLEISKSKRLGSFLNNNPVIPKMVMTYGRRGLGKQFYQKVLFDKIMQPILKEKDLNLELNAIKLLKEHISREEVRTGVKSTVNPRDITFNMAMEDEHISKLVKERTDKLIELTSSVLQGMIDNVNEIPYGLRWVCKQLDELLSSKHKESTESERASVIGFIVYFRFINPAFVSPESFDLVKSNQKISMNMRNNLILISKVLTNLTNNVLFDPKVEAQMCVMNDWLKINQKTYVEKFIRPLINVGDPEETLGVHQFMELTQKKNPTITISYTEMFSTHRLLRTYMAKIAPEANDPIRVVLEALGDAPEDPSEKGEEITLPLISNTTKEVDKVQEVKPEQLYEQVKENFRVVLKSLPVDALGEDVNDTLAKAKQAAEKPAPEKAEVAKNTLAKVKEIEAALPKLEQAGILSKSNKYRKLLIDITQEIQNQKAIRANQRKELERLKESLKSLEDHHQYLKKRIGEFEEYVEDARRKQFAQGSGSAKNLKRKKGKSKDKHKFSYAQLKAKGVIVDLNVMKSQLGVIGFVVSMPQPGEFDVEATLAGVAVKTISMTIDELLEKQAKGVPHISFDNVTLDVNMTLHLFNKLFSNK